MKKIFSTESKGWGNIKQKNAGLIIGGAAVFAFIAIGGFSIITSKNNNQAVPSTKAATNYSLFWSDEFNGTAVDTTRWGVYHNNYGSGNNELECNTPNNAAVSGGNLVITGKKQTYACPGAGTYQYTSAFLGSRDASTKRYYPLYGKYEMRARIPHGQGLWPAFWLRHNTGSSNAEVDVLEEFHSQMPGKITSTLHFPNTIGSNAAKKSTFVETPVQGTGGWHTYAVEIEPATAGAVKFTFSIDGVSTLTYTNTNASSWTTGYENNAWDIAVNMAIGGNWVGHPEQQLGYLPYPNKCSLNYSTPVNNDPATCSTTGIFLSGLSSRNAVYEVDYVRVYTPATATTPAPDTTAPAVTVTSPQNGATVKGSIVAAATATDNIGATKAELYVNNALKQTVQGAGPYSANIDTTTYANGSTLAIAWKAYDAAGNVGSATASVTVNNATVDTTAPSVPQNVVVSPVDLTAGEPINVSWSASTDNVGVARYFVTRDGGYAVGYTTTTSYSDTTADKSACVTYCHSYVIYALDAAGNTSAASAKAVGLVKDTAAPSAPASVQASATAYNKVSVSWAASTDNFGVTGYYIVRNGSTVGSVAGTAVSYVDLGVLPSTSYTYQVIAYDAAGNTATSLGAPATTPSAPDTSAPTVPQNVLAQAVSSTQINVTWAKSTDNIAVTSYKIYRNGTNVATVSASLTTSYGDSSLTANTAYSYTVSACDAAANCSAQSAASSATTKTNTTTGTVGGTVTNQFGGNVSRAKVRLSNATNSFTTYTNSTGQYFLSSLQQGDYSASYSARSYTPTTTTVSVPAGSQASKNVMLNKR